MSGPESFFEEQLAELDGFLVDPDLSVLRLIIDPEMERVPLRYLESRDADDSFRHLFLYHAEPFDSHMHWNKSLLTLLDEQIAENADDLAEVGFDTAATDRDDEFADRPWRIFLARAERLSNSLKDFADSLVVILLPETIGDSKNWARNIRFFADRVGTSALKFIAFESRTEPLLDDLEDHPKVKHQLFWLSPAEIEKRAEAELDTSASAEDTNAKQDPVGRRRALATVGIMASGRKDYARAEEVQTQHVKEAKAGGDATEFALALYNLGRTYIETDRPEEAVEVLIRAADGCCYHELDELAPMVFVNLGIALHRAGEQDEAFQCLSVSRDMFQTQRNLPGEVYVCDCLALLHHEVDKRDEAEKAWNYALKLYDGISNPAMEDVKTNGRADILAKLEHFGYSHAG
jgi:tetratricopeptide (TPR) repeat protein